MLNVEGIASNSPVVAPGAGWHKRAARAKRQISNNNGYCLLFIVYCLTFIVPPVEGYGLWHVGSNGDCLVRVFFKRVKIFSVSKIRKKH